MKQSGFRKKTYAEIIAIQEKAREKKVAKMKDTPRVIPVACIKRTGAPCNCKKCARKRHRKEKGLPPTKEERVKTLKTKLWAIFSKYIRKSYADPMTGMVLSCDGKYLHWQETHCGHFFNNSERSQSLGGNELWYYENNFAPQSSEGNYFNADDSAKIYAVWAVKRYGAAEVEKMMQMKQKERKFTEEELQAKYIYYKEKFDTL